MNEYLATDSGEYLRTNSLYALITVWLNASERSLNVGLLNRSVKDWILRDIKMLLYFYNYSKP